MKSSTKNPGKSRSKRRREILSKTFSTAPTRRKRRGSQFLRFHDVKGKTVEFVEMGTASDPGIEISFEDKTALHFTIDAGPTVEPIYSDWKTGNQRIIRRWTEIRVG